MRHLTHIVLMLVAVMMIATGCRTVHKTEMHHDTLTIERTVVQYIQQHDTLTIHDDSERIEERVIYDTLERVREVVRVQYRNRYLQEQGSHTQQVVHDTITIQSSAHSEATQTKTTTPMPMPWWFAVLLAGAAIFLLITLVRKI